MIVKLDSATRFVSFQFMLSAKFIAANRGFLENFRVKPVEMQDEHEERTARATGTLVVPPTEKVGLALFYVDMKYADYRLVAATTQERPNDRGEWYHMVRFTFVRGEFAKSPEFEEVRADLEARLWSLCTDSMWRAQVWKNPVYVDGKLVKGQVALDIDLKARIETVKGDGTQVFVWEKDENGKRVGDKKVLLSPDSFLRSA